MNRVDASAELVKKATKTCVWWPLLICASYVVAVIVYSLIGGGK